MPAAGSMNIHVEQWREAVTQPATTEAQEIRGWQRIRGFWVAMRRVNEGERYAAAMAQRYPVRAVVFTSHYFKDIRETDEIRWGSLHFHITGLGIVGAFEGLEISAEAHPDQSEAA
jgi:head-tail adaptor